MKKVFVPILTLILFACLLTGCRNALLDPRDPVTVTMWHNYGGDMQQTMDLLIDEFNSTVGRKEGIVIDVTAISSSSELDKSLGMIVNGDPGAPAMPDIFTGYPKIAVGFQQKGMLANFDSYFSPGELDGYVDAFVEEGRFGDGGLYVFPIAKSTEVLYVNQTLFDRFAAATGAKQEDLATFEGLARLSRQYYQWCGKQFYGADSWFNFAQVGMAQLGSSIFAGEGLSLDQDKFEYIFHTVYAPAVEGGIAVYDGYSSDLSKTGDVVCSIGSSAGILFYGDTITYADGTVENVQYSILPYPTFAGCAKTALQRGGGLMVAASTEEKEYAACVFIKWLTASEQNIRFIEKTGYLPVTKQAFETDLLAQLDTLDDSRIKKMLTSVLSMYDSYTFFTAPAYAGFDRDSDGFEAAFKKVLTDHREKFLAGEAVSADEALDRLRK